MDLLLREGRVAEVAAPNKIRGTAEEKFNARGLIVAPGFIDLHVHLREPGQSYKETFTSGTIAAAAGGFTSVCTMPNTVPVVDTADLVSWQRSPERGAVVNVFPIAAATRRARASRDRWGRLAGSCFTSVSASPAIFSTLFFADAVSSVHVSNRREYASSF